MLLQARDREMGGTAVVAVRPPGSPGSHGRHMTDRGFEIAEGRKLLSGHQLFGRLAPGELERLRALARVEDFGAGAVLFRKGEPGERRFAVLSGKVTIGNRLARGRVDVLDVLGAGRVFGEIALLDGGARAADAVALTQARLLVVERGDFIAFLQDRRDAAPRLIAALCRRLCRVNEPERYQAARFAKLPVRLARKLLLLAEIYGEATPEDPRIDLGLSQPALGDMTGASRESINAQLRAWREGNVIRMETGAIVIRDPGRLKGMVEA